MTKRTFYTILLLSVTSFILWSATTEQRPDHIGFKVGEHYGYKIKYGILTIGQADVDMSATLVKVNDRPCYKVNVLGRTVGVTDLFKVRNNYQSYIDTASILPQKFVYSAREGDYKRDQSFIFDRNRNKVMRYENNKKTEYKVPQNVQDVISSYYYLRTLDYSKLLSGSRPKAPLFFDDELYDMQVKFAGKSKVKTRFGSIDVLMLHPILPANSLFKDEESIRIFVSDDANRVPIRLEIDFKFGTVSMEMHSYKNVMHPFKWS